MVQVTRSASPAACRLAVALLCCATLFAGCAGPDPAAPSVPPQLFFDEINEPDELFLGKSIEEIRLLLRKAIDRPVTASFRSASLPTVVKELSQKSGLGIGLTPDVRSGAEPRPIDLDLRGMRARHALDWITRLIGACYVIEGPRTIFITRDRTWASQDRLRMRSYGIGTFARSSKPRLGRFNHTRESERLLQVFRYALRHTMTGHRDAAIVFDDTGSRLTAVLTQRGHAKLGELIEELKKPRKYEPPPTDLAAALRKALLATDVRCDFPKQDVRRIADELGRRTNVNIGFDYRLIPESRRSVALSLGKTTLGAALEELARTAGLGTVVPESGRRLWILGRGQTAELLRTTGELPWDRAIVRSYYVKDLVDHFGVRMIFNVIRKAVTPGKWDADLPLAFYHGPTGRLVVIHDADAQRLVAKSVDRMMNLGRTKRSREKRDE